MSEPGDSARFGDAAPGGGPGLPGGWLGQAGPYLLLAVAAAWLAAHWGEVPDPMITHWDLSMQPDGWSEKSPQAVFGLLAFGGLICLTTTLVSLGLVHRARPVEGPEEERRAEWRRRAASLQVLLLANWLTGLLIAVVSLYPLAQTPARIRLLLGATLALGVVGPLVLLVWIGLRLAPLQRGHRRRTAEIGRERWKLGLLYYAPEDPAIFVEKRVGIGYTVNFARRQVWLYLAVMLAAPVLLLAWMLS